MTIVKNGNTIKIVDIIDIKFLESNFYLQHDFLNIADKLVIDLNNIKSNTLLLVLLLSWVKQASGNRKSLLFTNIPDDLLVISKLYGVDKILKFS